MKAQPRPELLQFLAPGLLHSLGNALFKIQGHAQVLGSEAILAACQEAVETVHIYRQVLDPDLPAKPTKAGPLLRDLASLLRTHMRERGVTVRWSDELAGASTMVLRSAVVLPVVTAVHGLGNALPTGFEGALELATAPGPNLQLLLKISPTPGCLPFDIDLGPAIGAAARSLADHGGSAQAWDSGKGILLALPNPGTS